MHPVVTERLEMRKYARKCGDVSLERACDADLARYGYRDAPETTTLQDLPERAVPEAPRKRGRPPRPRCEHNQIAERCAECAEQEMNDV
jgi:hypothetical protein